MQLYNTFGCGFLKLIDVVITVSILSRTECICKCK